ncbi:haloalkane dehalogenase [Pontibacter ummariensis]|uniref:Haloalkane dehalogenase n=1 Tax=Pontibacter ummariensis TaxID=1610492 RepID=A0A239BW71_9BACT|nr:alpha/beta fold hydrolase [Pontibacter ummariensis]PRY15585.1 haloalkane dehalogenase [Pontibacter ummariensis]SNS12130.1 haloalkane dehalogenase [Pontibacter ummariensis]
MNTPKWLDRILYPFAPHSLTLEQGNMHYVDEGEGEPLVFVHGTPTWSFVWRQQIKSLSRQYRCIAPDHLGFGLSDKPADFSYTPAAHADNLEKLIEHLQLKQVTLVVHDFGGPIGLSYALRHPANVKALVILNTWMWSLAEEKTIRKASKFMSGSIGRFLYLQLGFSPRILLPQGYAQRRHLTKDIHSHYLKPLHTSTKRLGTWHFARALHEANPYFANLWEQRAKLKGIPKLILWGEKDKLLPRHFLDKWQQAFPEAQVETFKTGHFLQEEKGGEVSDAIKRFL